MKTDLNELLEALYDLVKNDNGYLSLLWLYQTVYRAAMLAPNFEMDPELRAQIHLSYERICGLLESVDALEGDTAAISELDNLSTLLAEVSSSLAESAKSNTKLQEENTALKQRLELLEAEKSEEVANA